MLTGDIFAQTTVQLAPASLLAGDRTRPILKIQDGCNNRCAYCVIPFVRGRSRSLFPDTVDRGSAAIGRGGREGNCFKRHQPGKLRSRSRDRELRLAAVVATNSGRDGTRPPPFQLHRATGHYRGFRRSGGFLRSPRASFSRPAAIRLRPDTESHASLVSERTICGTRSSHPPSATRCRDWRRCNRWLSGRDGEDFDVTLEFIARLPFTYLHVFSFSTRPGTETAKLGQAVDPNAIQERARALRSLSERKTVAFRADQAGRSGRALTLARNGEGWTEALTANYLKVPLAGRHAANEWHEIRIPKAGELAHTAKDCSTLENDLGECEVAAVRDGEGNFLYSETVGELARDAREI